MNTDVQHDPGYERRKAEFKRQYIKKKRRKRLIHNAIVIAIRLLLIILVLLIGFKIVDRIFLPLTETKKSQQITKTQVTAEATQDSSKQPYITPAGEAVDLLTIVGKDTPIKKGYVPELVECYHTIFVDRRMQQSLRSMVADANQAGCTLYVASGYRTEARQSTLYEAKADQDEPGYNEHELGLAVDVTSEEYMALDEGFAQTSDYEWLSSHCKEYGFILRYPQGKEEVTGHEFEPYHYRYVGNEAAKEIMDQGIVLEEYVK